MKEKVLPITFRKYLDHIKKYLKAQGIEAKIQGNNVEFYYSDHRYTFFSLEYVKCTIHICTTDRCVNPETNEVYREITIHDRGYFQEIREYLEEYEKLSGEEFIILKDPVEIYDY